MSKSAEKMDGRASGMKTELEKMIKRNMNPKINKMSEIK